MATAAPANHAAIDAINRKTMASPEAVELYSSLDDELTPPERAILDRLADEVRGCPILDLGVGAGRTVAPLLTLSRSYIAVDYVPEMVDACRKRYPDVDVRCADARDLSAFPDGHFKLVLFSSNGLCMVGHGDRQLILREVCRVLASDGAFVFSTYNRQSNDFSAGLVWPELKLVRNPLRSAWRVLQVAQAAVKSISNRRRNRRFEQHENEYAVINDRCHNYATMLYYIDIAQQRRQLAEAGFAPTAEVFDMQGRPVGDDAKDSSICFIARKQAHRA